MAVRAFCSILFRGSLPADIVTSLGLVRKEPKPAAPPRPVSDGALQLLGALQRDARLVDFLMEDIAGYSDADVGAALRKLHEQCRESLARLLKIVPVIDGVEGTYTSLGGTEPQLVKLLGKVPPDGRAAGGLLRHKGWRAEKVSLPTLGARQDASILAPAEVEIG